MCKKTSDLVKDSFPKSFVSYLSGSLHSSLFGSLSCLGEVILRQVSRNVSGSAAAHRDLRQPFGFQGES